jgi:hypothetical protein
MVSNFVVANLTCNNNDVFFNDEQAQGKDVDALCSLRFTFHMEKFKMLLSHKISMLKILLVILDNYVNLIACHAVLPSATITIEQATFTPICLLIAPVLSFTKKKLISLGKKYFLIPLEHLPYYPEIPGGVCM